MAVRDNEVPDWCIPFAAALTRAQEELEIQRQHDLQLLTANERLAYDRAIASGFSHELAIMALALGRNVAVALKL